MTRPTTETTPTPAAAWPPAVVTVNWNLAGRPCLAWRQRDAGADPARLRRGQRFDGRLPATMRRRPRHACASSRVRPIWLCRRQQPGHSAGVGRRRHGCCSSTTITASRPDFLARFAAGHGRPSRLALISPLILYHDEPDRIWSLGDYRIPGTLFTRHILRNRTVPADPLPFMPVDFQRLRHPGARRCLRPHRAAG
ncbi:MAG: hypothetical protein R2851_01565 [Caldilineaceae bacterium]